MKFFVIFLFSLVLALNGCKNPCKDVDCQHGVCNEGECTCEAGWLKDANGTCSVQDKCSNVSCGQGTCNDGVCTCQAGWAKDASGKCTVQDKCYGVSCGANGSCDPVNGDCICEQGYEGDSCSVVSRVKFLATFTAIEVGSLSGSDAFTIAISPRSDAIYKVLIGNAWNWFSNSVVATISGNTITIPIQLPDGDGYIIQGSGIISNGVVSVTYTVTAPTGEEDNVTGTWTKL